MKKFLALLSAMVMAMSLMAGCGSEPAPSEEAPAEGESTAAPAEETRLDEIKAAGKLVVGTSPDFVPLEFEDISSGKKEYVGAEIELAKYIAEKMGVELEIKAMDFMAIQQAVQSGVVDLGITGFSYKPERAEAMNLSDAYNITPDNQGLLVLAEGAESYTTAESFAGKKIGAQNASLQQSLAIENLKDAEIKPVGSVNEGILMLETGKIDALAVSLENAENFIAAHPTIAAAPYLFPHEGTGNVVAMAKGEDALLEEINKIIAEVNESGIFDTWKADAVELAKTLGLDA